MEKELSKEELQAFYDNVTESPHFKVYSTLSRKLSEICDAFDAEKAIVVNDDSQVFDNLLKFSDKVGKTLQTLEEVMAKIDPKRASQLKKEQKKLNTSSLEGYVK